MHYALRLTCYALHSSKEGVISSDPIETQWIEAFKNQFRLCAI